MKSPLVSLTAKAPLEVTASAVGEDKPLDIVETIPAGLIRHTRLLPVSATTTLPEAGSTATPRAPEKPPASVVCEPDEETSRIDDNADTIILPGVDNDAAIPIVPPGKEIGVPKLSESVETTPAGYETKRMRAPPPSDTAIRPKLVM